MLEKASVVYFWFQASVEMIQKSFIIQAWRDGSVVKMLAALPKDASSVLSAHTGRLTSACGSFSGGFGLLASAGPTYIHINKKKNKC